MCMYKLFYTKQFKQYIKFEVKKLQMKFINDGDKSTSKI